MLTATGARVLLEADADPGRLRVAFATRSYSGSPVHADCVAAVEDAAGLLEKLGHHVEEAAHPIDAKAYDKADLTIWASLAAALVEDAAVKTGRAPSPDDYEPMTWDFYQKGKKQPAWWCVEAIGHMQSLSRQVAGFFARFDVWLTPTLGEPPPPLGA